MTPAKGKIIMKLNEVAAYIESMEDLTTAKVILESLSDPTGYYFGIYYKLSKGISEGIKEKKVRKIINRYYEEKVIDNYEYYKAISYDINETTMINRLLRKEKFSKALSKINTMEELKRYLYILKNKLGNKAIDYNTYVPKYIPKKR